MKNDKKDNLYKKQYPKNHKFSFNSEVADVFEDMVKRSVPGYEFLINNIGIVAKKFYQPGTNVYDLGSSLSACSLSILKNVKNLDGKVFAIDSSEAMINICKKSIKDPKINFINSDICEYNIVNPSVVILNLTLQFVPTTKREYLLRRLFEELNTGGVIIIPEKVNLNKRQDNFLLQNFHDFFKENNGYSKEEIDRKKLALADSMIIESEKDHEKRFKNIGCNNFYQWFKCYNFASWVLIK